MLKPPAPRQHRLEMVTLEELVPPGHPLRLIDRRICFDFSQRYCSNDARAAVVSGQLFKTRYIGCRFGIRFERRLVSANRLNIAYHGLLGPGYRRRWGDYMPEFVGVSN